jgi:hypothetical protein
MLNHDLSRWAAGPLLVSNNARYQPDAATSGRLRIAIVRSCHKNLIAIATLAETAQLPESYEAAKRAIAECDRLDECSEWADKAAAIASYARQANDLELLTCAQRIRARAVRRLGELLKEYDARGGDRRSKNAAPLAFDRQSRRAVAQEAGVSEHKARTAVNIAAMPQDDFEAVVESATPPGTTKLAQWMQQQHPHPQDRVRAVTRRSLPWRLPSSKGKGRPPPGCGPIGASAGRDKS